MRSVWDREVGGSNPLAPTRVMMSILKILLPLSSNRLKPPVHACLDPISSQNDLLLNVFRISPCKSWSGIYLVALASSPVSTSQYRLHSKTLTHKRHAPGKIFFQKGRKSSNFCRLYPPSVIYLARQFSHFAQFLEVSDHTWRTARQQARSA